MDAREIAALIVAGLTTSALILKKVHENIQTGKDIYKEVRDVKSILPATEKPKSPQLDVSPKHWVVSLNAAIPDIMVKVDVINFEEHPVKIWLASIPYLYTAGIAIHHIIDVPLATIEKGKAELILARPLYPSEIEQFQRVQRKDEPHASFSFRMLCQYQGHDIEWIPTLQFADVKGSFSSGGQTRIVSDAEMVQSLLILESYCNQHGIDFPNEPKTSEPSK